MRILRHMVLVGWLVSCASAHAMTTGELLKLADARGAGNNAAMAFVLGAADMADALILLAPDIPQYCRPENVNGQQLLAVSKRYMENNPKDWHVPAVILIYRSFQNARPCPSK